MPSAEKDTSTSDGESRRDAVLTALRNASDPLSLSDLDDQVDVPYKSISATLSGLREDDRVERAGQGGVGDPYEYTLTETTDTAEPSQPETEVFSPDVSSNRTTRDVAMEYARTASSDEIQELWEAAGVIPDQAEVETSRPNLDEDDWVDAIFGISDSHLSVNRSRELIREIGREVWGDDE